mmetsp:Transcript_35057/g.65305  ORF Transcript_35057/g.65305 Transcript_35057/m.65305 type:complete len:201 (+) Transcript_35057:331-933(+)
MLDASLRHPPGTVAGRLHPAIGVFIVVDVVIPSHVWHVCDEIRTLIHHLPQYSVGGRCRHVAGLAPERHRVVVVSEEGVAHHALPLSGYFSFKFLSVFHCHQVLDPVFRPLDQLAGCGNCDAKRPAEPSGPTPSGGALGGHDPADDGKHPSTGLVLVVHLVRPKDHQHVGLCLNLHGRGVFIEGRQLQLTPAFAEEIDEH